MHNQLLFSTMARTVGCSTATKDRLRMSSFDELPGHNCSRSEQILVRSKQP